MSNEPEKLPHARLSSQKGPKKKPNYLSSGKRNSADESALSKSAAAGVLQCYVERPRLWDGHKFTLRLFALVTNATPLEAHMFDEGLVTLAHRPYALARLLDRLDGDGSRDQKDEKEKENEKEENEEVPKRKKKSRKERERESKLLKEAMHKLNTHLTGLDVPEPDEDEEEEGDDDEVEEGDGYGYGYDARRTRVGAHYGEEVEDEEDDEDDQDVQIGGSGRGGLSHLKHLDKSQGVDHLRQMERSGGGLDRLRELDSGSGVDKMKRLEAERHAGGGGLGQLRERERERLRRRPRVPKVVDRVRKLSALYEHLRHEGQDVDRLREELGDVVAKTLLLVAPNVHHAYSTVRPADVPASGCSASTHTLPKHELGRPIPPPPPPKPSHTRHLSSMSTTSSYSSDPLHLRDREREQEEVEVEEEKDEPEQEVPECACGCVCFELLEFHVALDADLRPWLLSVRRAPDLSISALEDDLSELERLQPPPQPALHSGLHSSLHSSSIAGSERDRLGFLTALGGRTPSGIDSLHSLDARSRTGLESLRELDARADPRAQQSAPVRRLAHTVDTLRSVKTHMLADLLQLLARKPLLAELARQQRALQKRIEFVRSSYQLYFTVLVHH